MVGPIGECPLDEVALNQEMADTLWKLSEQKTSLNWSLRLDWRRGGCGKARDRQPERVAPKRIQPAQEEDCDAGQGGSRKAQ